MVAIDHMRPKHVGLKQILTSYLEHQRAVTTKRTEFDLNKAKQREHIVIGLIKALSILDQVIKVIRASKNRKDATKNLVQQFDFTEKQADAIVALQLYRLTNTDVTELENEAATLKKAIAKYEKILSDPKELDKVIRQELQTIAKKYASPRKTKIQAKIASLKIETEVLVAQEDVIVQCTVNPVRRQCEGPDSGLTEVQFPHAILISINNTNRHAKRGNTAKHKTHYLL